MTNDNEPTKDTRGPVLVEPEPPEGYEVISATQFMKKNFGGRAKHLWTAKLEFTMLGPLAKNADLVHKMDGWLVPSTNSLGLRALRVVIVMERDDGSFVLFPAIHASTAEGLEMMITMMGKFEAPFAIVPPARPPPLIVH